MYKIYLAIILICIGIIVLQSRDRKLDSFEKTEIFHEEVERMGLYDAVDYKITKQGVEVLSKDGTASYFSNVYHLGMLKIGESKIINLLGVK